ncbi:MAG: preprotein translocase subunit SecE [Acutalibacteraceae bacterium]
MKNTKVLPNLFKALVCIFSVALITLFFFDFVKVGSEYTLTGFQSAFGSTQSISGGKDIATYKSAWYMFAFLLSAVTLVFSAANFKVKGAKYASFGFSIATFINMCAIYFANPVTKYFDVRPSTVASKDLATQLPFLLALIASGIVMVLATVSMLVSDSAEVKESNGTKITIPKRIKRFFKDYKREIKNIVWPSRSTVLRNFVVVLVMCAVVGAYIWLLDFGLAALLEFVIGLKG